MPGEKVGVRGLLHGSPWHKKFSYQALRAHHAKLETFDSTKVRLVDSEVPPSLHMSL
jgi:hypothetical protein